MSTNVLSTNVLPNLIKTAVAYYKQDPSAASVTMSWIERNQKWYASVVRYMASLGENKVVIAKAMASELKDCLSMLAVNFINIASQELLELTTTTIDTVRREILADKLILITNFSKSLDSKEGAKSGL